MAHALYEFMPYGAPDLISDAKRRMFRATVSSASFWILVFIVVAVAILTRPKTMELETKVFIPYHELAAPPPLTEAVAPPPQIAIVPTRAAPAIGVPVPVPDAEVPAEQTIASQQEIAAATGSVTAGTGTGQHVVLVEPPAADELPKLGDYVYADELPELIVDIQPHYPEIAREAQLDGEVLLRVLVGKDGRVVDVHVDASVPMLDDAAVEAARKWVFKPALSRNRPVAVWISRRLKFRLTTVQP